jgi:hypothetical protein
MLVGSASCSISPKASSLSPTAITTHNSCSLIHVTCLSINNSYIIYTISNPSVFDTVKELGFILTSNSNITCFIRFTSNISWINSCTGCASLHGMSEFPAFSKVPSSSCLKINCVKSTYHFTIQNEIQVERSILPIEKFHNIW